MSVESASLRDLLAENRSLDDALPAATPAVRDILERSLGGAELDDAAALRLLAVEGADLTALVRTADEIRRRDVGDVVTYVINRNVNFTNVCFVGCRFCAFKRQRWESDAYTHDADAVLAKVASAVELGATEICMQGGINPQTGAFTYRDMLRAIKQRFPSLHVHAFSPMEILYGSRRTGMSFEDYLRMLRDEGLGSIPGTAAEILDDEVREVLSHKKVDVAAWVEIVTTAHRLGIPSTSTIMYAHLETPEHIVAHLALLRRIQKDTGGFTEFVPLRFIHQNTDLYQRGLVTPIPKGAVDLRMYALSRLYFRGTIDNLQTSWVKLGHELATWTLAAGVNDLGGTLMEESISREAGADAGEYVPAEELRARILSMGRIPAQRSTLYRLLDGTERERDGVPSAPLAHRASASAFAAGAAAPVAVQ